jgi:hypothetical protein
MQISRSRPLKIAFWTFWAIVFLSAALVPWYARRAHRMDRLNAVPHEAVARVEMIQDPSRGDDILSSKPTDRAMLVRFGGRLLPVRQVLGGGSADRIRVGDEVRIVYTVGRSGRIYVDVARPLTAPAKPNPAQSPPPAPAAGGSAGSH